MDKETLTEMLKAETEHVKVCMHIADRVKVRLKETNPNPEAMVDKLTPVVQKWGDAIEAAHLSNAEVMMAIVYLLHQTNTHEFTRTHYAGAIWMLSKQMDQAEEKSKGDFND